MNVARASPRVCSIKEGITAIQLYILPSGTNDLKFDSLRYRCFLEPKKKKKFSIASSPFAIVPPYSFLHDLSDGLFEGFAFVPTVVTI